MSTDLPYRPCVGIMLINADKQVFVARRIDTPKDADQEAWQMPQGGIDDGETPRQAALRELEEEIGTANAVIIGETDGWLRYDLPSHLIGKVWKGKYRGQEQKWFLMRYSGADDEVNIHDREHPEFDAWKWAEVEDVPKNIVAFKRDIYTQIIGQFRSLIDAL